MGREVADELAGGGGYTRPGHSPALEAANPDPHCPTARRAGDLSASRRATRPSAAALIPLRGTQPRPHVPVKDGDNGTWPTAPGPRAAGLHSALQAAAPSPRPLRRPLVLPASPARPGPAPHGPERWRVPRSPPFPHPSFLLPSFRTQLWPPSPTAFSGPASLWSRPHQLFPCLHLSAGEEILSPAHRRRSPTAAAAAAVAAPAVPRDGAGPPHFPHPGLPALSRPHLSPTSGIGPGASQAPPSRATIGYKVHEAPPSHVKRALATPRAAD